ncbi:MAG: hypothetical protein ACR2PR_09075 [Pseudohongiellaceae bacterium]
MTPKFWLGVAMAAANAASIIAIIRNFTDESRPLMRDEALVLVGVHALNLFAAWVILP